MKSNGSPSCRHTPRTAEGAARHDRGMRGSIILLAAGGLLLAGLPAAATAAGPGTPAVDAVAPGFFAGPHDAPGPVPGKIGPDVFWPVPDTRMAPPDNPQIGDAWIWWLWIHYPMPPHFEQRSCTVRGISDHAYLVVEDSDWNVSIDQADADLILERWENSSIGPYSGQGIYAIDSTAFGAPPDELDDDPRIYLLWFDFGIASDGFFFEFDEYPEGTFPDYHSNECEVLYLNTTSTGGPSGDYMLSVMAHEFEHMIHWKYDADEVSWVDEGLAELAMWFYGRPDVISGFNTAPDNSLINWGGNWADYIQTYLWSLYFYERCGGHPAVFSAVHEPANSIAGYEVVLDAYGYPGNFADVFADWVVANFLDDPTLDDGRFGYVGDDLPAFSVMGTYSSYPVATLSRTVQYWAADYYRFQNLENIPSLRLQFDGSDNNRYAVWALRMPSGGSPAPLRMTVDLPTQSGTIDVSGLGDPGDQVVLVVASIASSGATSYTFSADATPADISAIAGGVDAPRLILRNSPNPSPGAVTLRLIEDAGTDGSGAQDARIDLFDAQGRLVREMLGTLRNGAATFVWDGLTATGRPASPGLYYARARAGSGTAESRILRLR